MTRTRPPLTPEAFSHGLRVMALAYIVGAVVATGLTVWLGVGW